MKPGEINPGNYRKDDRSTDGVDDQRGLQGKDAHADKHDRAAKCPAQQAQDEDYHKLSGSELSHFSSLCLRGPISVVPNSR